MKYTITMILCALAVAFLPIALGKPAAMRKASHPWYRQGGDYFNQDYIRGDSSNYDGGYQNQGSETFYSQGEKHHRTKEVFENEDSLSYNMGGSRRGSSSGGSYGRRDMYERGHLNAGGGFAMFGPGK